MKLISALALLLASTAMAGSEPARTDYEPVMTATTEQTLGPVGGSGDVLERLVVNVSTSATGTVSIKDGSGSPMAIVPANTPIGVYSVIVGSRSTNGAWKVTTGAGASAIAIGRFK